jgi:hypothetical protein
MFALSAKLQMMFSLSEFVNGLEKGVVVYPSGKDFTTEAQPGRRPLPKKKAEDVHVHVNDRRQRPRPR